MVDATEEPSQSTLVSEQLQTLEHNHHELKAQVKRLRNSAIHLTVWQHSKVK